MGRKLLKVLAGIATLAVALGVVALIKLGPRFVFGILRYDTRHEGELRVGDRGPDLTLRPLDGAAPVHLHEQLRGRPLLLLFGSFT
jgi:hypothetical protein